MTAYVYVDSFVVPMADSTLGKWNIFSDYVIKKIVNVAVVQPSSYGCTWEVCKAFKKLELLLATPRATLSLVPGLATCHMHPYLDGCRQQVYNFFLNNVHCPLSHLLSIVLFVSVPCFSIYRHAQNVAWGPLARFYWTLRRYCAYGTYCSHVNLKIICSGTLSGFWAPPFTHCSTKSAIVWIILIVVIAACRHLIILDFLCVCHAYRLTWS